MGETESLWGHCRLRGLQDLRPGARLFCCPPVAPCHRLFSPGQLLSVCLMSVYLPVLPLTALSPCSCHQGEPSSCRLCPPQDRRSWFRSSLCSSGLKFCIKEELLVLNRICHPKIRQQTHASSLSSPPLTFPEHVPR